MKTQVEIDQLITDSVPARKDPEYLNAFRKIFHASAQKVYGTARRILRRDDLAEYVLQETFLRFWQMRSRIDLDKKEEIKDLARMETTSILTGIATAVILIIFSTLLRLIFHD